MGMQRQGTESLLCIQIMLIIAWLWMPALGYGFGHDYVRRCDLSCRTQKTTVPKLTDDVYPPLPLEFSATLANPCGSPGTMAHGNSFRA